MQTLVIEEEAAAGLLHISPRTLQRWRVQGRGPVYVKVGKRVFYTEADLATYVNDCRRHSTGEPAA
jgi:predicted site-specific integrase-resolvase